RLALSSALSNLGIRVVAALARAWADCKPARKTHGLATVATRNLAVNNALAGRLPPSSRHTPCAPSDWADRTPRVPAAFPGSRAAFHPAHSLQPLAADVPAAAINP